MNTEPLKDKEIEERRKNLAFIRDNTVGESTGKRREIEQDHLFTTTLIMQEGWLATIDDLKAQLKFLQQVKVNQEPTLATFGRFLYENRINVFPRDAIAWRIERDQLSVEVDELADERDEWKDLLDNLLCWGVYPGLPSNANINDYAKGARWLLDRATGFAQDRDKVQEATKTEKDRRIEYQSVVYRTCNLIDVAYGLDPAHAIRFTDVPQYVERLITQRNDAQVLLLDTQRDVVEPLKMQRESAKAEAQRLSKLLTQVSNESANWQKAKRESDATIVDIVKLVPRDVENEDIFTAIKHTIEERDTAQAQLLQGKMEVITLKASRNKVIQGNVELLEALSSHVDTRMNLPSERFRYEGSERSKRDKRLLEGKLSEKYVSLEAAVQAFLLNFGSSTGEDGERRCNGLHTGHSLCEALS